LNDSTEISDTDLLPPSLVAFERADDVVAHPRLLPALNDDGAAGGELHSPVVVSWRLVPSSRRQLRHGAIGGS